MNLNVTFSENDNVKVAFSENDSFFDAKYENIQVVSTGEGGGYYLPTVSEDGNLSWEASKDGMPEVATVNVRGPRGVPGEPGKDGYTPVKNVDYFDGKPGVDGSPGADGEDGYTPVRGTDYWTDADKTEIISEVLANFVNVSEVGR